LSASPSKSDAARPVASTAVLVPLIFSETYLAESAASWTLRVICFVAAACSFIADTIIMEMAGSAKRCPGL